MLQMDRAEANHKHTHMHTCTVNSAQQSSYMKLMVTHTRLQTCTNVLSYALTYWLVLAYSMSILIISSHNFSSHMHAHTHARTHQAYF